MGERFHLSSAINTRCFLLYLGTLLFGLNSAQRMVTVQTGPLYRVEGSHITIWCNVSGYQGPSEQNFQWSIFLPSAPTREVQMISTLDPNFAYAVYGQRVQNKEIYIERLSGDSVRLHITKLQETDEGEYECHTPNTEVQYHGTYGAKMNLTVIPDTLRVTSVPQTLNKIEGDSVEMKCEVSKATAQHTHLSVVWILQKGSQKMEVLSLSRDFVLGSGSSFTQRHLSGDIRLDKTGETSYNLTIYKLQPSDQGEFFCEGIEWIQDPDNSWYAMTRKSSEKTVINVQATDKDFSVRLDTERRLFTVGETMELKCIIEAQNVAERYFAISWAFNSTPVATVGANAVAVLSGEFAQRESMGQLKLGKESDNVFVLKIYRLRLEDSGKYNCRVTEREKNAAGEFVDKENRRPKNVPITVQPLKSSISVDVKSNSASILEGGTLKFTCDVSSPSGTQNHLSVTWQLITNQNQHIDIAWLDQEGILQIGPSYQGRSAKGDLQLERVHPNSFTLGVYNTMKSEEGAYQCRVTEWVQDLDGELQRIGEQTASTIVSITALETGFIVTAVTRTPGVTYNDSVELHCIIKPRYPTSVPMSVTWRFQPAGGSVFYDIVTFTRDATIQWGDTYPNFKTRSALEKTEPNGNVRLTIGRASDGEAGKYQCAAELWRKNYDDTWTKIANKSSSAVEIKVLRPTSKLKVSKSKRSIELVENSIIQLNCSVMSQTSLDSRFSVLWYGQKSSDADGKLILKISHNSAYEYGTYADEEGLKGRLQFEKSSAGLFSITVRKAKVSDSGSYYCHVEEWLLNPNSAWYKLAEEVSGLTEVAVKQPDKNLRVSRNLQNITVTENSHIPLSCSITNRTSQESRMSVEWYIQKPSREQQRIVKLNQNAVFEYGDLADEDSLKTRLQFDRPSDGLYRLVVQKADTSDSGSYFCHVEEWLLNPDNIWYKRAEDRSEPTIITVQHPEIRLQLEKAESNTTVQEKGNFQLDCKILSHSKEESQFAVSWYLKANEESAELKNKQVFSIGHDSVFGKESEGWGGRLQFKRPTATHYSLIVQEAIVTDTGNYGCHVEEWILNPNNEWYKLAEDESELAIITVESTGSSLQSVICSNDSLFYFVFFYPFPIFGILIITILLVRYKRRNSSKNSESKNGVPLLWIKEPHLNYSPTCLEPPNLSIHPGSIE